MLKTYFVPRNADGSDIPSQARRLGTDRYGFANAETAYRHTPAGGYVEKRYVDGMDDWADGIVRRKPE